MTGGCGTMTDAAAGGRWHAVGPVEALAPGEWQAAVRVPGESAWFAGHFPGDPILPGIAQLGMVGEVARRALGEPMRLSGFSRIKFKKIVRPGDALTVTLTCRPELPGVLAFRIESGGEVACSGTLSTEQAAGTRRLGS
jgi:3-hydroxymyristoyl/3-hydroxydecanoyl-(acyl carrier protein) dehydratase